VLRIMMAVFFKLLLLVLAATCLAEAFQCLPRQQRLFQGESQDPGIFGDASFDKFIMEVMHEYHVPGLSLAVIDNDQIAAMVLQRGSNKMTPLLIAVLGLRHRRIARYTGYT
jgi:CubicO group peptidase (beta-lactamase class C family)